MQRTLIIAAVVAALPLGYAIAGKGGHHGFFDKLDADKDGRITKAEAAAFNETRFKAEDADGDGKLSAAEMEARMLERVREHVARRIKAMDTDGDGAVSLAERQAAGEARFAKMDKDGDGAIGKDEIGRHHGRHHDGDGKGEAPK